MTTWEFCERSFGGKFTVVLQWEILLRECVKHLYGCCYRELLWETDYQCFSWQMTKSEPS